MIEVAGTAIFDAAGDAVIQFGGPPPSSAWDVARVAVTTTSDATTTATLHRSTIAPATVIDVARGSGNGNTSAVGFTLSRGETLVVVWRGGTVGAVATATVSYEQRTER